MSTTTPNPARSAIELLSKETLDLTDADIEAICADLRARRERFLAGQKDTMPKPKKEAAPITPESKQQNSDAVLGEIGNLF